MGSFDFALSPEDGIWKNQARPAVCFNQRFYFLVADEHVSCLITFSILLWNSFLLLCHTGSLSFPLLYLPPVPDCLSSHLFSPHVPIIVPFNQNQIYRNQSMLLDYCLKRYFARGNFILNIPCSVPYFSLLKIAPPPSQCVSVLCHLHNWTSSGIRGSHPGADCRHQDLHPVPPSWGRTTGHLATGKAVAVWNRQRREAKSRHQKSLWRGHVLPGVVL